MCGIAGILSTEKINKYQEKRLNKIRNELKTRGFDSEKTYVMKNIAITHTRLSIQDLSIEACQPFKFENLYITFNGEIYNSIQLKEELICNGYSFKTNSDTEVLIKGYHFWGKEVVTKLNGDFAFAIWDELQEKLFIARDRFGIRPLYYIFTEQEFWFSSTLPSLARNIIGGAKVSHKAIHYYFGMQAVIPPPHTMIDGCSKLEPGNYIILSFTKDHRSIVKQEVSYYKPRFKYIDYDKKSEDEYISSVKRFLISSIEKRLIGNRKLAIWLSGGLDSSLITAICNKELGIEFNTLSIGFNNNKYQDGNEFIFSRYVSDLYSRNHQELLVDENEICDAIYNALGDSNEPMISNDYLGHYLLAKYSAKQDNRIVLSGLGADEVWYGYGWHRNGDFSSSNKTDLFKNIFQEYDLGIISKFVNKEYTCDDYTKSFINNYLSSKNGENFKDIVECNLNLIMVEDPVKRADIAGMSHAVEIRAPFLDHEFVDYSLTIPDEMKLKNNIGKYILKKISLEYFDKDFVFRNKGHFEVPSIKYTTGKVGEMCKEILLSASCRNRGIYNMDFINSLIDNNDQQITELGGNLLWELASLEYWLSQLG